MILHVQLQAVDRSEGRCCCAVPLARVEVVSSGPDEHTHNGRKAMVIGTEHLHRFLAVTVMQWMVYHEQNGQLWASFATNCPV
jgi:hypothetical protein